MRRALLTLAVILAGVLALPASALAYINAPGTPVRDPQAGTYNALPVTGACTIAGVTSPITQFKLSLVEVANYVEATPTGLVFHYSLTAECGQDYVLGDFTVPLAYSIDDAAGTLTFTGLSVPASFTGETIDGYTGTATVDSGAGPLGPVVYGADTSAEKKTVVSTHRSVDRAKTDADRARLLTSLIAALT